MLISLLIFVVDLIIDMWPFVSYQDYGTMSCVTSDIDATFFQLMTSLTLYNFSLQQHLDP